MKPGNVGYHLLVQQWVPGTTIIATIRYSNLGKGWVYWYITYSTCFHLQNVGKYALSRCCMPLDTIYLFIFKKTKNHNSQAQGSE